jgi:predicted nicotinamide N-methyase
VATTETDESAQQRVLSIMQGSVQEISFVVWDAGLLLTDYLIAVCRREGTRLGRVLDIGCGTGICGMVALSLGAASVCFTDSCVFAELHENIASCGMSEAEQAGRSSFVHYDWTDPAVPVDFTGSSSCSCSSSKQQQEAGGLIEWDTVICSDLLYFVAMHAPLMNFLKALRFRRALFSYKKRHPEHERLFFDALASFCSLRVVRTDSLPLTNLSRQALGGLYIILAEPRPQSINP